MRTALFVAAIALTTLVSGCVNPTDVAPKTPGGDGGPTGQLRIKAIDASVDLADFQYLNVTLGAITTETSGDAMRTLHSAAQTFDLVHAATLEAGTTIAGPSYIDATHYKYVKTVVSAAAGRAWNRTASPHHLVDVAVTFTSPFTVTGSFEVEKDVLNTFDVAFNAHKVSNAYVLSVSADDSGVHV